MGLKLTLPKDKNTFCYDFIDAYWAIWQVQYSVTAVGFRLSAYPTREAKLADGSIIENPSIGYGSCDSTVRSELYHWNAQFPIEMIFPEGIPMGKDAQYTAIYNFIKAYTELPFEDVLEEEETDEEEVSE